MSVPPTVLAAPASLYVGDLHQDVSDGQLFDAFCEFKSLSSVRVCRDLPTGRSLCYGYVNFISAEDANRAIEVKNNSILNGKVIRVLWSNRDSDGRRSGIGNVFIKNLGEDIDNTKLQEVFEKFGNILSCKVVMNDDGKSKGYGFVQFESEESANSAIEKLNGTAIGGKQMYVAKFVKKSDRVLPSPDAKFTNLYMKNLDPDVTEEHLKEKFSVFGKIVSLVVSKDENRVSRGFGFVNFESPNDAKQAMEAMNGSQLGTKVLYVARAQKKAERLQILSRQFEEKRKENILKYQASNVYVKNIEDSVTDDELREHFSQCGKITSVKIMRDEKGISKGFGFVCFSTPEEATKAVNTYHGYMFHQKPLYVALAQRKEERRTQLQLHYAQHMAIAGLTGPSAVIPGGYPPVYYTGPGVVPQVSPRPGLMYQPLGFGSAWRANGFAPPTRPSFQPSPVPLIPNTPRQRQNRGRIDGNIPSQGSGYPASHFPHPNQLTTSLKDSSNQQRAGQYKYVPNGRLRQVNRDSDMSPTAGAEGSEMLSSMLAAAPPEKQKQILGERLYPLVSQHKPDLAAKITGMLLEMDNLELLLLLESPESLTAKVEEAIQVLELSKTKVSGQDNLHPGILSSEVAVN